MSASSRFLRAAAIGWGAAVLAASQLAAGEDTPAKPRRVGLSLIVSQVSSEPGPVDPSAGEIHRRLHDEFHTQSFRVIERHHMDLRMQEIGGFDLPTGKRVELRPLALSPSGVLISVDIPGTLQTDVRVPNRKQVVIGVDRYEAGKLILTLEPNY